MERERGGGIEGKVGGKGMRKKTCREIHAHKMRGEKVRNERNVRKFCQESQCVRCVFHTLCLALAVCCMHCVLHVLCVACAASHVLCVVGAMSCLQCLLCVFCCARCVLHMMCLARTVFCT
jgi:hypothetical protein